MATTAQIVANRRNAQKSTGPRTHDGKNNSRFNALDHGCRANLLVLPTEVFGEYEAESLAWKRSWKPRNPSEEFLIDRLVSLGCLNRRIERAHTARLATRIANGDVDAADNERAQVISLGQLLLAFPVSAQASQAKHAAGKPARDGKSPGRSRVETDLDHPMKVVHHLQTTITGCEWLLEQWDGLRALLDRGVPWLAPDKHNAVLLLGRLPAEALFRDDVVMVHLASHVLRNQEGDPFQDILDNLAPDESPIFRRLCQERCYMPLAPKDAAAAKQALVDIVDRATIRLEEKLEVLRELAELRAPYNADRLSWDDTAEGERLRRYELTCKRASSRMLDLLLKIRSSGAELDIATIESISRSAPIVIMETSDQLERSVANVVSPATEPFEEPDETIEEPDPVIEGPNATIEEAIPPNEANLACENAPNEANSACENAPNEANSDVQTPATGRLDGGKGFRIDTPHVGRKLGGIGVTRKERRGPDLQWQPSGQSSTLMDLSPIFGER